MGNELNNVIIALNKPPKKGLGLSNFYCKIYFITYNWTEKSIYVKICEGLFSITETTWVRNQRGGSINQLHLTTNKQTWLPKASWLLGDCTASCIGISDVHQNALDAGLLVYFTEQSCV